MMLEDFNYFINKAINLFVNKRYNTYDINQQSTDDMRVLKSTARIPVDEKANKVTSSFNQGSINLNGATYEVNLPDDYFHILNCVCIYQLKKPFKCYDQGNHVAFAAKRLTSDSWSSVLNDYYNRPTPQRPYYFIHNVNKDDSLPTNPVTYINGELSKGTDVNYSEIPSSGYPGELTATYIGETSSKLIFGLEYTLLLTNGSNKYYTLSVGGESESRLGMLPGGIEMLTSYIVPEIILNEKGKYVFDSVIEDSPTVIKQTSIKSTKQTLPKTIKVGYKTVSTTVSERESGVRYGNTSKIRMEIRYGHDTNVFGLKEVQIDYLKTPQYIRLTQEQVNKTEDTSQVLEWPDYVCQEIINELVMLVMENTADPRLLTRQVSQSIASPAQPSTPQQ